jgi:Holliday junction resolvase RusA-like endonuclease
MSKRHLTLKTRIPPYVYPRNEWRRKINQEATKCLDESKISYSREDQLELLIKLYLKKRALDFHDLDNRLKDIMDALQGRGGGGKKKPTFQPVLKNDAQVYRVIIEKTSSPKQGREFGHLTIRKYSVRRKKQAQI